MTPTTDAREEQPAPVPAIPLQRLQQVVLRLVKGGPERRAIVAGEADAILDPESGGAFLLPVAQRWLLERGLRPQPDAPAPDQATRAALDALTTQVAVLDRAGVVLSTNNAWREIAPGALGAGVREGVNYLDACAAAPGADPVDGPALAAGIRQVIAGERRIFRFEHACELGQRRCWFAFSVTPAEGGGAARAVVARDDITEQRRGELLLELEYAVARILGAADAPDAPDAALQSVMQAVCESQGWDCGRYFRLDPATAALQLVQSWGLGTPAVRAFLARSRSGALQPAGSLEGRVCRSGQPLWIVGGAADTGVSAAMLAPGTERDGAFIFPVATGDRTLGVLAFAGRGIRAPDDRMLQAVRAIGAQLGRFLQQQQALAALRRSGARFRRLTEISTDFYWEQDRDGRLTDYVGATVPGDDMPIGQRLRELPSVAAGGTDWADHEAQVGARWSFCDFEFIAIGADGTPRHFSISGEPVFDIAGGFIGYRGTGLDITRRKQTESARRSVR